MSQAREHASNLPGGELVIDEQEEVMQMLEQLRDRKKCRSFSVFCLCPLTYPVEISWHGFLNGRLHPLRNQPPAYKWRSTRQPPLQWPTSRQRLLSSLSSHASFNPYLVFFLHAGRFRSWSSCIPYQSRVSCPFFCLPMDI